jgi:hypothetical protein
LGLGAGLGFCQWTGRYGKPRLSALKRQTVLFTMVFLAHFVQIPQNFRDVSVPVISWEISVYTGICFGRISICAKNVNQFPSRFLQVFDFVGTNGLLNLLSK